MDFEQHGVLLSPFICRPLSGCWTGNCALIVSGEDAILIDAGITAMGERVTRISQRSWDFPPDSRHRNTCTRRPYRRYGSCPASVSHRNALSVPDRLLRHTPTNPCWRLPRIWVQRYGFPLPDRFYSFWRKRFYDISLTSTDSVHENINDSSIISLFLKTEHVFCLQEMQRDRQNASCLPCVRTLPVMSSKLHITEAIHRLPMPF